MYKFTRRSSRRTIRQSLQVKMVVFALLSVPIATVLAYLPHVIKGSILSKHGKYDNKKPRAKPSVDEKTDELITRLTGAHNNQLESLGVYAGAIASATAVGVSPVALGNAAAVYIGARSAYVAAYIAPQVGNGAPRSLSFSASFATIMWIWFAAAAKAAKKDE